MRKENLSTRLQTTVIMSDGNWDTKIPAIMDGGRIAIVLHTLLLANHKDLANIRVRQLAFPMSPAVPQQPSRWDFKFGIKIKLTWRLPKNALWQQRTCTKWRERRRDINRGILTAPLIAIWRTPGLMTWNGPLLNYSRQLARMVILKTPSVTPNSQLLCRG